MVRLQTVRFFYKQAGGVYAVAAFASLKAKLSQRIPYPVSNFLIDLQRQKERSLFSGVALPFL